VVKVAGNEHILNTSENATIKNGSNEARHQQLTPIILAIWEGKNGRISIGGKPRKNIQETPSYSTAEHSGTQLSSQPTQRSEGLQFQASPAWK
jgi:hypothetical protein